MTPIENISLHILGENIESTNFSSLGGKGWKLAELAFLRYRVPKGFVIPSELFDSYMEKVLAWSDYRDDFFNGKLLNPSKFCNYAQQQIRLMQFDEIFLSQLEGSFHKLGLKNVSVRSSFALEDGASTSFAGIFETSLNVDRTSLETNIKHCWASLFSDRSYEYLLQNEKSINAKKSVGMAVVVQEMVDCDVSGVCFTRHPSHGAETDLMLVEAVWGLGEGLVSGEIVPDQYVYNRTSKAIVQLSISEQSWMVSQNSNRDNNSQMFRVAQSLAKIQKLTHQEISALIELGLDLELLEEHPCDIEFGFKNGKLYLFQCRPITTF